jgi:hypothetical protein
VTAVLFATYLAFLTGPAETVLIETAKARMIEKNVFMVLRDSFLTARARLPGCRRDCAADRWFKFRKRSQLFIRTRNETLSIIAVGIGNERRSLATIHGCNTTPIPSGFAQIVGADFPFTRAAPTSWRNNLSSDQQLARKEFPRDGPRTFSGLVIRASLWFSWIASGHLARRLEQEIKRMFQIAARDSEFKKVSAGVGADIDLGA